MLSPASVAISGRVFFLLLFCFLFFFPFEGRRRRRRREGKKKKKKHVRQLAWQNKAFSSPKHEAGG